MRQSLNRAADNGVAVFDLMRALVVGMAGFQTAARLLDRSGSVKCPQTRRNLSSGRPDRAR